MLPGSICRENIPAPFSWQEVSPSFSVETCAPLCKNLPPGCGGFVGTRAHHHLVFPGELLPEESLLVGHKKIEGA